jgi:hypothetical protein
MFFVRYLVNPAEPEPAAQPTPSFSLACYNTSPAALSAPDMPALAALLGPERVCVSCACCGRV